MPVLLGEDEWSFRAEGLLSPGSTSWDMTLGASADLIPVIALSGGPTSPCTPGPSIVATPLAQAFSVVITGAASGKPFSARDAPASSGHWVGQDVFIGSNLQLACEFHFSQGGMAR